ncbi:50S ribosomal protein L10 [Pseudanabaena sp. ABRG5-3]|uniref:50S ribosomal protein L10 n=1 Tax=Pseudanabaena sp. ABRG5-3 TaxID=685565 RepID=UPI000DC7331E|nr:50S ribosomal protein L10 [Pseudanabaena sp. ABRG5-3]BBC25531.1 50S ribosomal protein L10 [Pseudanabaena sp. ABRG5-3]
MGKTLEQKKALVNEISQEFDGTKLVIVIDYATLSVAEITKLRRSLRPTGTVCRTTKNTLLKQAISGTPEWQPLEKFLVGPSACLFVKDDIGGAVKAYQAFLKESKKTELRGGVLEGRALSAKDLQAIADLPSKEVLISQIAGAINAVTAKIAIGIKEVPQSLGRAIKAVSEKEAA